MEPTAEQKQDQQVKFNLGSFQLQQIAGLLEQAAKHYLASDVAEWFFTLRSVRMQFQARLKHEERLQFKGMETVIEKLKRLDGGRFPVWAVSSYQSYIMDILEQKGFLVPTLDSTDSVYSRE